MCGRFTLTVSLEKILERFTLSQGQFDFQPRYNLAPAQKAPVIFKDKTPHLEFMKWGLVPHWAKDSKIGYKMINARSETVSSKPSFRHPFRHKRCLIPGDSFYEWEGDKTSKSKIPIRFLLKDRSLFAFAGLWEEWLNDDGAALHTFSIITTPANKVVSPIHHRMPAILKKEDERVWLDHNIKDLEIVQNLLNPFPEEKMDSYRIAPLVNFVKNDSPECIAPSTELSQPDLFSD
jgi:putative SOS response-associated peptidase YedK